MREREGCVMSGVEFYLVLVCTYVQKAGVKIGNGL